MTSIRAINYIHNLNYLEQHKYHTCFPVLGKVSMLVPLTTGAFSLTPPFGALPFPKAITKTNQQTLNREHELVFPRRENAIAFF